MAPYYPPPDTNQLLHPLLACLPMAFISSQPPPALLPLLSPILRQRVKLLSETQSTTDASWLPLLCWESADASELPSTVENISFEAHPVSGELEFGDVERAMYRRLDEETLQSRTALPDIGLVVIYTWCTNDAEGGSDGWRISEFKPLKDVEADRSRPWYTTFSEADEKFNSDVETDAQTSQVTGIETNGSTAQVNEQEDDDDAYWSQYDQRASETPGQGSTPAPQTNRGTNNTDPGTEQDYYDRYDSVEPEIDAEDPNEDKKAVGESSLPGNILLEQRTQTSNTANDAEHIVHTRPSSSTSSAVAHLEQSAESQSHAEMAIQQHISSSIKSLYRLTRGAGIESAEFRRLVQNELDCLSLMDEE